MSKANQGFTLIELMIIISIISILTTMALPSYQDQIIRSQIKEAFNLAHIACTEIETFYKTNTTFPKNNKAAGLPAPEKLIGNYVKQVIVTNGVINVTLGNRINRHVLDKVVTIRPAIVENEPKVPISWVYGFASVPQGMKVIGKNNSTVLARHLPINCRY